MKKIGRISAILLILLLNLWVVNAQDDDSVSVVGSGIVNPVLNDIIDANELDLPFEITTTGTSDGFTQFCAGDAAITTATRPIGIEEQAACQENGVELIELLIGHDIMVLVANSEDTYLSCLLNTEIDTLFAPSSANTVTNWDMFNETSTNPETPVPQMFPDQEIQVILPSDNTLTYMVLDDLVSGVGFRSDATTSDIESIIDTVASSSGAIGAVSFDRAVGTAGVVPISIDFGTEDNGCVPPSPEAVEANVYPASTSLFVYVNRSEQSELEDLLEVLGGESIRQTILDAGYTPVSPQAVATNLAIIAGEQETRGISEDSSSAFEVPAVLGGEITLGGTSMASRIASSISSQLPSTQETLTVTANFNGESVDEAAFCAGELDIVFSNKAKGVVCDDASGIEGQTFSLGHQVVVLVGNSTDDHVACLTSDQITTIWGSPSTDVVTNWQDVGESMPDQDMTLFGLREGRITSDILLGMGSGAPVLPVRVDTEQNNDPLYRAAAVANVDGALTYMTWAEYQRVLGNNQEGIQLILVDGGAGCVLPGEDTIRSGEYPLAMPVSVTVSVSRLHDEAIQSFLWLLFADENLFTLRNFDISGIDPADLSATRGQLLIAFDEAIAAFVENAQAEAEATAEPDVEAEATQEAESD